VIALGASAGGIVALDRILSELPPDLPSAVVVVQHLEPHRPSLLAEILNRHTELVVTEARDGERLRPGRVYIAPPDRHLLVEADGTLRLSAEGPARGLRPSADRLFESVAAHAGGRVIAVVLTGTGRDGAAGIVAVKRGGGTVLAQDRTSSAFFGMPSAAVATGSVDQVLPLDAIAAELRRLASEAAS
jgi:two-component system chemotaxis response regulator CheB